jgi:hypothetical protein
VIPLLLLLQSILQQGLGLLWRGILLDGHEAPLQTELIKVCLVDLRTSGSCIQVLVPRLAVLNHDPLAWLECVVIRLPFLVVPAFDDPVFDLDAHLLPHRSWDYRLERLFLLAMRLSLLTTCGSSMVFELSSFFSCLSP